MKNVLVDRKKYINTGDQITVEMINIKFVMNVIELIDNKS